MSAIWGCVDLSGAALPDGLSAVMERPLHEYKIDRYDSISEKNVVMGCGLQYVKKWSDKESLPMHDADSQTFFTADCLIDNRKDLIAELCPGNSDIADGTLMFLAYKKWGEEMVKRIYGSYSYAIYDAGKRRLIVGADHVFSRCIYYQRVGSKVYFSTIIESIIQGVGEKARLNEEWLALFLSKRPISVLTNPVDTPYMGVNRIVASHYRMFANDSEAELEYWSPKKNAVRLRLNDDNAYRELFREIFGRCVRETIDGLTDEPAILLSGGFDSSSVAAFAAMDLAKSGKKLHGYTNVPVPGHVSPYRPSVYKTDETEDVLRFCDKYANVVPNIKSLPEADGFSGMREILSVFEIPYKSLINIDWIYRLMGLAAKDSCRLMLTGQTGNATISWGDIAVYERHLLTHGRLRKAINVLSDYSKLVGGSRRKHFKYLLSSFLPAWLRGIPKDKDYHEGSYVDREALNRLGIGPRDSRLAENDRRRGSSITSYRKHKSLIFNPVAHAQISEAYTKLALKTGMVIRDPTCDIRVFEFCLSVPIEVFVNSEPATRRLARSYLSDMLPMEMLPESAHRGRQSGDWYERISARLEPILDEMEHVFSSERSPGIIDAAAALAATGKYRKGLDRRSDQMTFLRLGAAYCAALLVSGREWE